jgi:UDP-2,3-diacylglucosamine pyrophosphatase LpxH
LSALKYLLVIGILLTASGFTSDLLGEYLGPIEYKGYIVFDYPEGENPIINIVFTVDPTLAGNLIIVNVPSPWSHSYGGGILALSGGSLGPGGSVSVTVSLNKYFEDGEYAVSSVGTTSAGEVSLASGPLLVGELYLLNGLRMASAYKFPLLALVVGLGFLEGLISRGKRGDALAPGLGEEGGIEQPVDTGTGTRTRERDGDEGPGTTTTDDDGDDPRDIPPPTYYGEELEVDPTVSPVYVISDFHLGSNIDSVKEKSNDMDGDTLKMFLKWLDSVDVDAGEADHYDVVMNGDFFDLWQAKKSVDDTNADMIKDVLDSNNDFFSQLAQLLKGRYPRCRFYFLIGNHDDAFFSSTDGSHMTARNSLKKDLSQDWSLWPMSFNIDTTYTNGQYKLHIEHGHEFDSFNWKGDEDRAIGQKIAEKINQMQEANPAFRNIEYTPNQEFVKYLICLKENEKTPKKILDIIGEFESVAMWANIENSKLGALWDGLKYVGKIRPFLVSGDRFALDHPNVEPKKVKDDNRGFAEKIMEEKPEVKIVVLGHIHFTDLIKMAGEKGYANTGTWLKKVRASKDSKDCLLKTSPSPLPYVKISKALESNEDGEDIALVELKYYRGMFQDQMIKVRV